MKAMNKEEETFQKYFERLRLEFQNAWIHFNIYLSLKRARDRYHDALMQAPEFFALTERSHYLDSIIRVNRICDDDKRTLNMVKLLNYCKTNLRIFSDDSYRERVGYSRIQNPDEPVIDKLYLTAQINKFLDIQESNMKALRNKALAHIDKDDVINKTLPYYEYQVSDDEIQAALDLIESSLDALGSAYANSRYPKGFPFVFDGMENMFKLLTKD